MTFTPPTFVLVPGAWQGGWAWQPVARRLREAGYAAVTITLPGLAGHRVRRPDRPDPGDGARRARVDADPPGRGNHGAAQDLSR